MLCIIFCYINQSQLFSVELVGQNNISADCYQLILLMSVCLAFDFKQDQEPVKRQNMGDTELCSDCQSDCRLLFVSFWTQWLLL